jgi:nitroreductase
MCRSFAHKAPTDQLIKRLLYAANRAPAAGNVRTSQIIVIRDRYTITEIKRVSPGFAGICPVLFAVCTDQTATQEDDVASFDAGTIAENIALAAVDVGLGVCFLKSFPDRVVQQLLKIPQQRAKIEMLVCVGYPAQDQPKAKTKSIPLRLFEESYGNLAEPKTLSAPTRHDIKNDVPRVNNLEAENTKEDENDGYSSLFDLALFILTSARTTIDESSRYGPKRLVDTLIRVLDIPKASLVQKSGDQGDEQFLSSIRAELARRSDLRSSSMVYTKEFKDFLDNLIDRFVAEMERRRKV